TGREAESGTARLGWTQGVSPVRWLAARLTLPALLVTASTALLAALHRWAWTAGDGRVDTAKPWYDAATFYAGGLLPVALALAGLAAGALAGLLLGRSLPALAAGAAALGALWTALHHALPQPVALGHPGQRPGRGPVGRGPVGQGGRPRRRGRAGGRPVPERVGTGLPGRTGAARRHRLLPRLPPRRALLAAPAGGRRRAAARHRPADRGRVPAAAPQHGLSARRPGPEGTARGGDATGPGVPPGPPARAREPPPTHPTAPVPHPCGAPGIPLALSRTSCLRNRGFRRAWDPRAHGSRRAAAAAAPGEDREERAPRAPVRPPRGFRRARDGVRTEQWVHEPAECPGTGTARAALRGLHRRAPTAHRGGRGLRSGTRHRRRPGRLRGDAGGRRRPAAAGPLPRPGAQLARLQRARPRTGRGSRHPAAGTRELPRDLRQQPRRVLHGPGGRSEAPHRHRRRHPLRL